MEESIEDVKMLRRKRALVSAREYVQELYAIKNDKGYPRFSGNAESVLKEELEVAAFLLGEEQ